MNNILGGLAGVSILEPIDAVDTAAATSAWVACSNYQGLITLVCFAGILDAGTLTWTFTEADNVTGTGAAAIVPVGGALTQVTTANDNPNIQLAQFDARAPRGFIQAVGTVVTGGALVSVSMFGLPQYS